MADALIRLEDVKRTYLLGETLVQAVRGVTLELHAGELTALVGPSGSGKSTLLNLVGCIDAPDAGRVLVEGVDVATLSDDDRSRLRNRKIGFIFQSFNLVPVLDAQENVELPLLLQGVSPAERRARVKQAIADVGLEEFARHPPDKLSGGQRQRVAIARALVTRPLLVLADEPTANLDSTTARRILDLMADLNARLGVTFLFSTHDEKLMARVTRHVHVRDGLLVDDVASAPAAPRAEASA
jgi:putative ABC transport system ATP-binding protein